MNIALNEANTLQKRIDELQKQISSLIPKPVKERKDLNELQVEFEKIRLQIQKLGQRVKKGEIEESQKVYNEREALQQQINVLTATRDVCLQKAGKQNNTGACEVKNSWQSMDTLKLPIT